MVLLTMTAAIVEALGQVELPVEAEDGLPSLQDPAVGKPISHGQIIDLARALWGEGIKDRRLETLLLGCWVYIPPSPPKPEPSAEYKALMARLRHEEEERAYERMINPPPPAETAAQRRAQAFAAVNKAHKSDLGDDEVTYNDVHRQLMLILNFMLSILGTAATLWVVARWWSTPSRLFLTLGGSLLVGIAEVAVYSGYVWHLSEAKKKDTKFKEVKEVVQTWVVDNDSVKEKNVTSIEVLPKDGNEDTNATLRRRKKESL